MICTREFLQRSGKHFSVMKVLQSGLYHYRFVVDGQCRCAPELPRASDDMGNTFHILDLQVNLVTRDFGYFSFAYGLISTNLYLKIVLLGFVWFVDSLKEKIRERVKNFII